MDNQPNLDHVETMQFAVYQRVGGLRAPVPVSETKTGYNQDQSINFSRNDNYVYNRPDIEAAINQEKAGAGSAYAAWLGKVVISSDSRKTEIHNVFNTWEFKFNTELH